MPPENYKRKQSVVFSNVKAGLPLFLKDKAQAGGTNQSGHNQAETGKISDLRSKSTEHLKRYILYISIALILYLILGGVTFWILEQPHQNKQCELSHDVLDRKIAEYVGVYKDREEKRKSAGKGQESQDLSLMLSNFVKQSAQDLKHHYLYECHKQSDGTLAGDGSEKGDEEDFTSSGRVKKYSIVIYFLFLFDVKRKYTRPSLLPSTASQRSSHYGTWSFSQSLFYSFTVITTIGYGGRTPKSGLGKIVTIIYALIGFSIVGSFVQLTSFRIKSTLNKRSNIFFIKRSKYKRIIYMLFVVLIYIVTPTVFFYFIENLYLGHKTWNFLTCFYYVIITLSTIGFGDYVPTLDTTSLHTALVLLYQSVIFIWILAGLVTFKIWLEMLNDSMKHLYKANKSNLKKVQSRASVCAGEIKRSLTLESLNDNAANLSRRASKSFVWIDSALRDGVSSTSQTNQKSISSSMPFLMRQNTTGSLPPGFLNFNLPPRGGMHGDSNSLSGSIWAMNNGINTSMDSNDGYQGSQSSINYDFSSRRRSSKFSSDDFQKIRDAQEQEYRNRSIPAGRRSSVGDLNNQPKPRANLSLNAPAIMPLCRVSKIIQEDDENEHDHLGRKSFRKSIRKSMALRRSRMHSDPDRPGPGAIKTNKINNTGCNSANNAKMPAPLVVTSKQNEENLGLGTQLNSLVSIQTNETDNSSGLTEEEPVARLSSFRKSFLDANKMRESHFHHQTNFGTGSHSHGSSETQSVSQSVTHSQGSLSQVGPKESEHHQSSSFSRSPSTISVSQTFYRPSTLSVMSTISSVGVTETGSLQGEILGAHETPNPSETQSRPSNTSISRISHLSYASTRPSLASIAIEGKPIGRASQALPSSTRTSTLSATNISLAPSLRPSTSASVASRNSLKAFDEESLFAATTKLSFRKSFIDRKMDVMPDDIEEEEDLNESSVLVQDKSDDLDQSCSMVKMEQSPESVSSRDSDQSIKFLVVPNYR